MVRFIHAGLDIIDFCLGLFVLVLFASALLSLARELLRGPRQKKAR